MMRKINFILCAITVFSVCLFSGCGRDPDVISFSGEASSQEAGEENGNESSGKNVGMDSGPLESSSSEAKEIVIYVCGAVRNPGIVVLPEDSRVNDAVLAAGGLTGEAASEFVNLAARVTDEEMIYIPTREEAEQEGWKSSAPSATAEKSSLININTADTYELCKLPGIGESKAQDIITYREKNGAFQQKEDIMNVAGIKENLYEKICDRISVK